MFALTTFYFCVYAITIACITSCWAALCAATRNKQALSLFTTVYLNH